MINLIWRFLLSMWGIFFMSMVYAEEKVLNIYTWAEEIPAQIIHQFEKETGIRVNHSFFESNEVMFAKLRTNRKSYDLVEPSSYYIEKMQRHNMLEVLDKTQLSNMKYLDPFFLNQCFDPNNRFSLPFVWGVTGIFINNHYFKQNTVLAWQDLTDAVFKDQLMLLNEARAVFSIALRMLDYSINDSDPTHIKAAYLKLKSLMPNVRLFNSDAVLSILIDEDAKIGMSWNADLSKALSENPELKFIFPTDGFEIWVDNFVLLKNAPHRENAYLFLNFLMRPDIARDVSQMIHYATTNLAAKKLLPLSTQQNTTLYPSYATLSRGEFQSDIGEEAATLIEKYWEYLKMGG